MGEAIGIVLQRRGCAAGTLLGVLVVTAAVAQGRPCHTGRERGFGREERETEREREEEERRAGSGTAVVVVGLE